MSFNADLLEIIFLSLEVSGFAVLLSTLIGLPLGAALALFAIPGRTLWIILINALMGLPPVVVGLCVYLLLSRQGPLGVIEWLYTPAGMIMAQMILVIPIITGLSRQVIADTWVDYDEQLRSLGVKRLQAIQTILWDARFSLVITIIMGFSRAISEVGAIMIVGGNIEHLTRVMTTAIVLETRKGNLQDALMLGLILLSITITINATVHLFTQYAEKRYG